MNIKLYSCPHTRAFRVHWLLEELQATYELEYVNLFKGEANSQSYKSVHPLGYLPAIEADGVPMFESGAICSWLTSQFPEKKLAPAQNAKNRREYEQWMYFVPGEVEPPIFYYGLHNRILPKEVQVKDVLPWLMDRYTHVLETLQHQLENREYLLGEKFSTADIMLGSTLNWAPKLLKPYNALEEYVARLSKRKPYIKALNENNKKLEE